MPETIPASSARLVAEGNEGVGMILRPGTNPEVAKRFSEGQRVAFFPAMGSWAEYVVVRYNSLLPVPDEVSAGCIHYFSMTVNSDQFSDV
jgi:D-arabinose 1-dehydrogenase-like Zn-dependent alcohol dehydrogenase